MTAAEVMQELEQMGNPNTKKILMKHGAQEPFFGVKVADMKKIVKKVKKDHSLSLELYATGNADAMYLAGLIADEKQISKAQLQDWAEKAYWYMISEYSVAWVAAESAYGWELGLGWIQSEEEQIAAAGWSTLTSIASIRPSEDLDIPKYDALLEQVNQEIHDQPQNRVRYNMNGFVIGVGSFIPELTDKAIDIAKNIGKVSVDMNGTACKVPLAADYIQKVMDKGRIGKKKKMARC